MEGAAAEGLQFLESDPQDADAINAKQKEIEGKFNPIMMRVYQAAGGPAGGPPWFPAGPLASPLASPIGVSLSLLGVTLLRCH